MKKPDFADKKGHHKAGETHEDIALWDISSLERRWVALIIIVQQHERWCADVYRLLFGERKTSGQSKLKPSVIRLAVRGRYYRESISDGEALTKLKPR